MLSGSTPTRPLGPGRLCPNHDWRLATDDVDEFGPLRVYECSNCDRVRYT